MEIFRVVLVCLWICVASGSAAAPQRCRCFHLYRPVCGDDGHTYGNHCEARCQGVTVVRRGECPATDTVRVSEVDGDVPPVRETCMCPFSFRPVCGDDGRTYPNRCAATCREIGVSSEGRCVAGSPACVCPPTRRLVCGVDGTTYQNACEARCRNQEISHAGRCVDGASDPGACVCNLRLQPVCAENGKTYANPCQARCDGQTFTMGRCPRN